MGYQNKTRPADDNKELLLYDALADMSDLIDDVRHNIDCQKLEEALLFVRETIRKAII